MSLGDELIRDDIASTALLLVTTALLLVTTALLLVTTALHD